VHVLFTGDEHVKAATPEEWESAVREAERQLGLADKHVPRIGHIVLPAA
jgi:hypothetical protein